MKTGRKILSVMLCGIIAAASVGCGKKVENAESTESVAIPVETMVIEKGNIESTYRYSGKVKPENEVDVISTVSGKAAKVNVKVGDIVKKGDILFEIDTETIEDNLKTIRASLATAEANYASAKTSTELVNGAAMQSQTENAKAALANAEIAYNQAKTNYENSKVLFDSGAISKTQMDQVSDGFKQTEIAYNQAKTSYDLIVNVIPVENARKASDGLRIAEASRNAAKAQYDVTAKMLQDAKVTAPIDGTVSSCMVSQGAMVSQSASPVTIIDDSSLKVSVSVSEQLINNLKSESMVDLKIAAVSPNAIKGKILSVSPASDQTGNYPIEIGIDNAAGEIKSGMFAEIYFIKDKNDDTFAIPRSAMLTKNDEDYVFVEENGLAKKITVTPGIDTGEEVEIKSGIKSGMNLIVKGQTYLLDGDKVELTAKTKEE